MDQEDDIQKLANALQRIAPSVRPSIDLAWSNPTAIQIVDCVLSLNRNYDRFVVPRLQKLMQAHPKLSSAAQLAALIDSYPSPSTFVETELNYQHPDRARVLREVTQFACECADGAPPEQERSALERWAAAAKPQEYRNLGIKGFKLAGFQYLRMLLGAQTTKPDKHIVAFVSETLGRTVTAVKALVMLEEAAVRASLPIRDVDTTVWETRARD